MDDGATLEAQLDGLLLSAARLAVAVRKAYACVKRDACSRFFTYVLLLQGGKIYVGNTDNIYQRLLEHHAMSPSSAVWVREHGPVARVLEISRNCAVDDEMYKTLEYMCLFGWENVRGAGWCRVDMKAPPLALAGFRREARAFEYLTRAEVDGVVRHVAQLAAELAQGF